MSNKGKKAYMTGAIIAANVIYFLYLETAGSSLDNRFMIQNGAMYAPLVLQYGQYYRLLTSVFMHFGISHLLNNMLVLFVLGDNLERALGKVKYLIFYLFCGVGANLYSLMFHMGEQGYYVVSAGASGAIFGVVGGLVYAVAVNKGHLEDLSTSQLIILVLFTLYHGFTNAGIDNNAHIGGLIAGMLLGVVFYRKPRGNNHNGRYKSQR